VNAQLNAKQSLIWLDVARALAAAVVLAGHLRAYVFRDFGMSGNVSLLWKAFYFVTSLQHQAVVVFFVLSGFLISKTISVQESTGRWSWTLYALKRLSRLWIVLLPALILTFFWDQIGMRLTGSALYSGGLDFANHSTPITALSFSPATFFGNVAFLQTIKVPPFGTDTPLWSLANEFWYYVVFPLFYFALRNRYSVATRVGLLCAGAALCSWLLPSQCPLGLIWLLGYGAFLLQRHAKSQPNRIRLMTILGSLVLLAVALISPVLFGLHGIGQDALTGVAFALLLVPLSSLNVWNFVAQPARLFAGFSYTLYVVHFPFLSFLMCAVIRNRRFEPGAEGLCVFAILFTAAMVYAYLIALIFERNTSEIQAWLVRKLEHLAPRRAHSAIALAAE
jgi:peptidoglycan/LPS O-acetylase OafA/YrhL